MIIEILFRRDIRAGCQIINLGCRDIIRDRNRIRKTCLGDGVYIYIYTAVLRRGDLGWCGLA